jgi:hypothetical protein
METVAAHACAEEAPSPPACSNAGIALGSCARGSRPGPTGRRAGERAARSSGRDSGRIRAPARAAAVHDAVHRSHHAGDGGPGALAATGGSQRSVEEEPAVRRLGDGDRERSGPTRRARDPGRRARAADRRAPGARREGEAAPRPRYSAKGTPAAPSPYADERSRRAVVRSVARQGCAPAPRSRRRSNHLSKTGVVKIAGRHGGMYQFTVSAL